MARSAETIRLELDTDPLSRGYAAMSDSEAAADMNLPIRSRNRSSMTLDEIMPLIDLTELAALTATEQRTFLAFQNGAITNGVDPFGWAQPWLVSLFGGGSATIAALAAARVESIGRGLEIGFGNVTTGDIQTARSLP